MAGIYDDVSLSGMWDTMKQGVKDVEGNEYYQKAKNAIIPSIPKAATDMGVEALYNLRSRQLGDENAPAPGETGMSNEQVDPTLAGGQGYKGAPGQPGIIPTGEWDAHSLADQSKADPNSQAGGAEAAAKQQAEMDKTSQKVADEATKGGKVLPDATSSSAADVLAAKNQNTNSGTGNQITGVNKVDMPAPLTEQQQKNNMLDQAGDGEFKSMNTINNWYESKSFLMGMMQTGLSLLDGKGYAESFASGSQYFDQHYGKEQRANWADDLLKKGYDRQEIQQYIETGDAKTLTSPEQRIAKLQAQQTAQQQATANLQSTQLANQAAANKLTPEYLAQEAEDRDITNQYKRSQAAQMQAEAELKSSPEYRQSLIEKNQAQAQASQARTEHLQADTRLKQQKTSSYATDANGAAVRLGANYGSTGFQVVLGEKDGKPAVTSGGRETWVYDPKTKSQFTVPTNNVVALQTESDAEQLGKQLEEFRDENGLKYFGVGGELRRKFGDTMMNRTTADLKSRIKDIDGKTQSLLVDSILAMQPGFAVKDAEIEAKKYSAGQLIDPKTGEIEEISGERADEIVQERMQAANRILAMARARREGTSATQTPQQLNAQQVSKGDIITRGGKKFVALQDGSVKDPIFQPYNG